MTTRRSASNTTQFKCSFLVFQSFFLGLFLEKKKIIIIWGTRTSATGLFSAGGILYRNFEKEKKNFFKIRFRGCWFENLLPRCKRLFSHTRWKELWRENTKPKQTRINKNRPNGSVTRDISHERFSPRHIVRSGLLTNLDEGDPSRQKRPKCSCTSRSTIHRFSSTRI